MSEVPGLAVAADGAVLALTLERPDKGNAVTAEIAAGLIDAIETASQDDTTRVVIIRGQGKNFCSGFDISGNRGDGPQPRAGHMERRLAAGAHRLIETIQYAQVPVVTVVAGWAAGFGNVLALSGDYVVADTSAKFWVPFVGRGFTPDSGTTWILPRLVGMARAKDMVLRSRPVAAEEALRWGLISQVTEPGDLEAAAAAIVAELAAAATVSVGLAKQLLAQNSNATLSDSLRNEAMTEELAIRTADFKEGMRAFGERRGATFEGR
ncbi:enoyl-CoA hydratase/isomerase family protein [Acidiferrimicrobium sp. IK]|uniref:enoyl-CoA hydratase/isomerase family protein n=1 Tax=Acidiferrimicrobium sp. IK TaxID=2871700 RepID=UPI0021CB8D68|nr:enoyl-CoA hydratase-related protein [Acidiferrimicrobium sp. IK]MCU4183233.1 enoyl-CoA hydratase/isomerase family protein [Acidiferrimicrobium sp. IK]